MKKDWTRISSRWNDTNNRYYELQSPVFIVPHGAFYLRLRILQPVKVFPCFLSFLFINVNESPRYTYLPFNTFILRVIGYRKVNHRPNKPSYCNECFWNVDMFQNLSKKMKWRSFERSTFNINFKRSLRKAGKRGGKMVGTVYEGGNICEATLPACA